LEFKCEILYTYVDNVCVHIVKNSLEITSITALPPGDFSAFKKFCSKTRARNLPFFWNDNYQFTFNYLNSDINFVNYDMIFMICFVVNFDNFYKNM